MAKKKIFHNSDKDTRIDSIGKAIQYLYYRMCQYYEKIEKGRFGGSKRIDGLIGVGGLFTINIGTLLFFLMATDLTSLLYELPKIQPYFLQRVIYGGVPILIIYMTLYYSLGKKYDEIYLKYYKETSKQRKYRGWIIVLYVFTTLILFVISGYVMNQNRSEEWKKEHRKEREIPKIQFKLPKKKDTIK